MNEVDFILTMAKLASRDNPWAHLATHTLSMGYNLSMVGYYGYQLGNLNAAYYSAGYGQSQAVDYATFEQIQRLKQERTKHVILGVVDGLGLILYAINSLRESGRSSR